MERIMENLTSAGALDILGADVDLSLLERVNPVFNTAKMTLFMMASSGDADAAALVERLGLTADEVEGTLDADEQALNDIIVETRFRTMGKLALESGCATEVDLPCGYTPRALEFARLGHPFVGMDLPAAILEAKPAVMSLLPEDQKHLVRHFGVDATNYDSLKEAFDQIEGEVCITTEGLLMYFTDSETAQLCDSIHKILSEHGGCWLLADAEVAVQHVLTARAIYGDRFMEMMMRGKDRVDKKSDFNVGANSLILNVRKDLGESMKESMAFLAKHGLKAERLIVGAHAPEIRALKKLPTDRAAQIRASMSNYAYWKIVPTERQQLDTSEAKGERMKLVAELDGGTLKLKIQGRLDTLTAPELLSFFEKTNKAHEIDAVRIDCTDLVYVSSAGLRTILLMLKATGSVTLEAPNASVREVLEQTGFDTFLDIED